jgi:acyl-CoA thioesterase
VSTTLHAFDADTAVRPLGGGRFAAEMSERWWVVKGPNGGYVAAVVLRALEAAVGEERPPRSLTVQFPRAPAAGPVEIETELVREGRSATFAAARLTQGGEVQATALAVFSTDHSGLDYADAEMPAVEPPGELYEPDPSEIRGMPPMMENYSFRQALGDSPFSGGRPLTGGWIRTRDPRPLDAPLAAALLDAWIPASFVPASGPILAPTLDYTVHFRAPLPPPGATPEEPYLVSIGSRLSRGGFFEEDGELWSADGVLLAQSRQLALALERS